MQNIQDLVYLAVITDKNKEDKLCHWLERTGCTVFLRLSGRGTARAEMISYYGFATTQKTLFLAAVARADAMSRLAALTREFRLSKPGKGIAFLLPQYDAQGDDSMQNAEHDLILTVTNHGYADMVMDEARAAGARGGTLLYARGTAVKLAEVVARSVVQPEKDMLLILSPHEIRDGIIAAINANPVLHDEAATIVFSLPVGAVAGMAFENWK